MTSRPQGGKTKSDDSRSAQFPTVKDDDNNGDLLKMSTTSSIVATGGGGPTATGGRIGRRSGSTDSGRGRVEAEHGIEH